MAYILGCARRFQQRCAFTAPRIIAVPRGPDFERVTHATTRGLVHLINPWLTSTHASHLLLCTTIQPKDEAGISKSVEQAAMCMQVAVLAATELGYGTCWMAGLNYRQVERAYPCKTGPG